MFKNIRTIAKLIGTTDISSIGNGTLSGGISALNASLTKENVRDVMVNDNIAPNTPDTVITLAHEFSKFRNISLYVVYNGTILAETTVDRALFVSQGLTLEACYFDGTAKVQVMCKYSSDTKAVLSSTNNPFTVGYWIVGTN